MNEIKTDTTTTTPHDENKDEVSLREPNSFLVKRLGFTTPEGNWTPAFNDAVQGIAVKIKDAINRLRSLSPDLLDGIYIGTSGGKDSVLVHWLMKKAWQGSQPSLVKPWNGEEFMIVHTTKTSVTHPKTLEFLYSRNFPIMYCPAGKHSSLGLKTQIDGTRRSEFDRTDGRSTDLIGDNGVTLSREHMQMIVRNGLFGLNFVYPIYDWSDEDVWAAIWCNDIPYTQEYAELLK